MNDTHEFRTWYEPDPERFEYLLPADHVDRARRNMELLKDAADAEVPQA